MSFSAANALGRNVTHSIEVAVAAISLSTYAPTDGTPALATINGSPATNRVVVYRDRTGGIFFTRSDATGGTVIGTPKRIESARELFELFAEGLATALPEIGDKDAA